MANPPYFLSACSGSKDQAQIVGRHRDALDEIQSVLVREIGNLPEVAHSPLWIAGLEDAVKTRVACRRVVAVLLEGAIEIKHAAGRERPRGTGHQPLRGAPWRNVDHVDRND